MIIAQRALDRERRALLAWAAGLSEAAVAAEKEIALDESAAARWQDGTAKMDAGWPLEHVTGICHADGIALAIVHPLLVPRPETEHWTKEYAAPEAKKEEKTADLCCGTGVVGLAYAREAARRGNVLSAITFVDYNPLALETARANWQKYGNPETAATFLQNKNADSFFDWWPANANEIPDVILCNPPYLSAEDRDPAVGKGEGHRALLADENGMKAYRLILEGLAARNWHGVLWLEIDPRRAEETASLARARGAVETNVFEDQFGRKRVLTVRT